MQSLLDKLGANATTLIYAAIVLAAVILVVVVLRMLIGRRVHPAGAARTRQPRLGVVDAFDLDRQRQLVLVRRDNVEHLILIGGPSDVLIEATIVRAGAEARARPAAGGDESGPAPAAQAPLAPVMPVAVPAPVVP